MNQQTKTSGGYVIDQPQKNKPLPKGYNEAKRQPPKGHWEPVRIWSKQTDGFFNVNEFGKDKGAGWVI
jgi:hypothetical protein